MKYLKKNISFYVNRIFISTCLALVMGLLSNPKTAFAQQKEKVYSVADKMPEIKGGLSSLYKKIKYPQKARKSGISGRVYIQFIVDKNGDVKNPKVLKGIGGGCDKAAVSAIKDVKFKPGKKGGKNVNVKFTLPVAFRLQE